MKMMKKVFALGLIFSLLMSMTVFGADCSGAVSMGVKTEEKIDLSDIKMSADALKQTGNRRIKRGTTMPVSSVYTRSALAEYMQDENNLAAVRIDNKGQVQDCTFTATSTGKLYLNVLAGNNNDGTAKVEIIRDSDGKRTKTISSGLSINQSIVGIATVSKGKKYHVRFTDISSYEAAGIYGAIGCIVSGSSSRNFASSYAKDNYGLGAGTDASGDQVTTYWKKYVSKKGRLAITAADIWEGDYNVYVTLLDKNKKVVSPKIALDDETAYFGVYGDRNYYVKVQTSAPIYGIRCSRYSYSSSPGTSKSKATKLSKESSRSTTLGASTSSTSSHWYRIYLSSRKSFKMDFAGYVSPGASVRMQFRNSSGKVLKELKITGKKGTKMTAYIKGSSVPKGTYYVRISKVSSKSSAAYKLTYTY